MHQRIPRLLLRRGAYLIVQLWGVVTITFFLVRLIPGNPAIAFAGAGASSESIQAVSQQFGFDEPLFVQYGIYLNNLVQGDLGVSLFTGHSVASDLATRVPATLELVVLSMLIVVIVGIPLGVYTAVRPHGAVGKGANTYGMLTGSLPDFWLGLILIFVFFYLLGWAPAPLGRLGPTVSPPEHYTGSYVIDSIVSGNVTSLGTALSHLVLPIATLVLVYMGNTVKMARSSMTEALQSDYVEYARACGLPERVVLRYALRNALAPIVTVVAFTFGFLLGGAVLVETIFSWGGLGQYAVQSVANSDYSAVTGFVLMAALMMAIIYLVLDLVYAALDPRIEH